MGTEVARLFDATADSYDQLEPWYDHLYTALHAILRAALSPDSGELSRPAPGDDASLGRRTRQADARTLTGPEEIRLGTRSGTPPSEKGTCRRALDAGCGTGFQTALLDDLGYETHGFDISGGLVAVARRRLERPAFALASIESLPYRDGRFDVVTCCGSTLSFTQAPDQALREIGRVLRPGGVLMLECEHKWSLDLAWAWLSSVTGDSLGYGTSPREIWRQLARPLRDGFHLDYPGYGRIRLFTIPELRAMLHDAGLRPMRLWGIHMITNLIPSTILHRERLPRPLAALYGWLCAADGALGRFPPAPWVANSIVVLARKDGATDHPPDSQGPVPHRRR
jgi:MPBQ/MSBQ methyltransferase